MKVHVVNMAENYRTTRAQRHVVLHKQLKKDKKAGFFFTTNFNHADKSRLKPVGRDSLEVDVPVLGYKNHFGVFRLISHVQFALQLFVLLLLKVKSDDKLVCSSIPSELPFVVFLASIFKRFDYCIDIRDTWPDALTISSFFSKVFSSYCNLLNYFSYRFASRLFYSNEDFKGHIERVSPKSASVYLPLGCDTKRWSKVSVNDSRSGCVYIGNFNSQFDISIFNQEQLLECYDSIALIGGGEKDALYKKEFPKARFYGYLPPDVVVEELSKFRVGLLPISGSATLPNKLYDYILAGLDILTNSLEMATKLSRERDNIVEQGGGYLVKNCDCNRSFIVDYEEIAGNMICEILEERD